MVLRANSGPLTYQASVLSCDLSPWPKILFFFFFLTQTRLCSGLLMACTHTHSAVRPACILTAILSPRPCYFISLFSPLQKILLCDKVDLEKDKMTSHLTFNGHLRPTCEFILLFCSISHFSFCSKKDRIWGSQGATQCPGLNTGLEHARHML